MKGATACLKKVMMSLAAICCLIACHLDDGPPSSALTKYDLPPELAEEIFTADVLKITGSLEPFLDRIQLHGMRINPGNNAPAIYFPFRDDQLVGVDFYVSNECIYDEKYPSYADSLFGAYQDNILILEEEQDVARAIVSYSSESDTLYLNGLDRGSGEGIATGMDDNFTIFYRAKNGRFDKIPYQAVWIISGTFTFGPNNQPQLSNVTKCMILLEKGADPDQQMANTGTIRIFRDPAPAWRD